MKNIFIVFLLLLSCNVFAKSEKEYQAPWCTAQKGQQEVRLPDRTRVDCLTAEYAVEVEFANKWAEAVGQSLYYAFQTNKKAGIALIFRKDSDRKYWYRLNSVIEHYGLPIRVWEIHQ